jgi:hypothetical protein
MGEAQHPQAERNDCDCRSYFQGAQCAENPAIDPVETGFPGAGMSRETHFFITACETANRRVPAMEVTPPEYQPGSA